MAAKQAEALFGEREEDLVLRCEVAVDRARAVFDLCGDIADRHLRVAVADEQRQRGIEDGAPGRGARVLLTLLAAQGFFRCAVRYRLNIVQYSKQCSVQTPAEPCQTRFEAYTRRIPGKKEPSVSIRPVKRVAQSKPTLEGAGVKLRRAFGFGDTSEYDPFLLFDDFRNDNPDEYLAGFPVASPPRHRDDHLRAGGDRRARRQPWESREPRRG